METLSADARYEKVWYQYLSLLESRPRLCLAPFLRSLHVHQRGFENWMSRHGHSVGEAKGRALQLRMDAMAAPSESSAFLPVEVSAPAGCPDVSVLTGISLTLPDGTVISIRRGSAEAVVSFLRLYSGEGSPCSD